MKLANIFLDSMIINVNLKETTSEHSVNNVIEQ